MTGAAAFARRMLPAAVLAGALVALVPPAVYGSLASWKRAAEAETLAVEIASRLAPLAAREPTLWQYNAAKIVEASAAHRLRPDLLGVRVTDCAGRDVPGAEESIVGGVGAWAPVATGMTIAGFVGVSMDSTGLLTTTGLVALLSGLLGLGLGMFLFRMPVRVVREQQERLSEGLQAIRVQEGERRRIGRDLHDGLGQALTALHIGLELAREREEERPRRLDEAIATCAEAVSEMRRVVHDLEPPELATDSLDDVLRAVTERFEVRTGIPVSFRSDLRNRPADVVSIGLLRVLQEGLSNVGRHASAHEVGVRLGQDGVEVTLAIEDDGCGFDPARVERRGLEGMRERCGFLGGTVDVTSKPGDGTQIRVRLPMEAKPS